MQASDVCEINFNYLSLIQIVKLKSFFDLHSRNMATQTVKLASGYSMPLVGFGLWKVDQAITADTVYAAIQTGYRLFDGAYDYANEKEAGEGIRRAIKDGLVKRDDIFVTTKLWNNYHKK